MSIAYYSMPNNYSQYQCTHLFIKHKILYYVYKMYIYPSIITSIYVEKIDMVVFTV